MESASIFRQNVLWKELSEDPSENGLGCRGSRKKHRILFHDPLWACAIAQECYPNDPNAICAANLHILADRLCSSDRGLKTTFENLEMFDRKKRKSIRKQAPRDDDALAKVFSDLKKIEEIKRMLRILNSQ